MQRKHIATKINYQGREIKYEITTHFNYVAKLKEKEYKDIAIEEELISLYEIENEQTRKNRELLIETLKERVGETTAKEIEDRFHYIFKSKNYRIIPFFIDEAVSVIWHILIAKNSREEISECTGMLTQLIMCIENVFSLHKYK